MCISRTKIILTGLVAGFVALIAGLAVNAIFQSVFPRIAYEYAFELVYRPFTNPLMLYIFMHPFVMSLLLAWAYPRVLVATRRETLRRGASYGLFIFGIMAIPGMVMTYSTFQMSLPMLLSWTAMAFVQLVAGGMVIAKMLEQEMKESAGKAVSAPKVSKKRRRR